MARVPACTAARPVETLPEGAAGAALAVPALLPKDELLLLLLLLLQGPRPL